MTRSSTRLRSTRARGSSPTPNAPLQGRRRRGVRRAAPLSTEARRGRARALRTAAGSTRRAALLIVLSAALAALLAGYRPSLSPPALHPRETVSRSRPDGRARRHAGLSQIGDHRTGDERQLETRRAARGQLRALPPERPRTRPCSARPPACTARASAPRDRSRCCSAATTSSPSRPPPPNPIQVDHAYRLLLDVDGERPMLLDLRAGTHVRSGNRDSWTAPARCSCGMFGRISPTAGATTADTVVLRTLGPTSRWPRGQRRPLAG